MDGNKLSYRLQKVAEYVPVDSRLADIGSDHAYLPAYLSLKGKINFGIAGEVVKGPFQNAQNEIKKEEKQLEKELNYIKKLDEKLQKSNQK